MSNDHLSEKQRVWLDHVEACVAAGISMKSYAEKNGLDLQSFYLWKGRLKKLGLIAGQGTQIDTTTVCVTPPLIAESPIAAASVLHGMRIELGNGVCIQVPDDFDVEALCSLVRHAAGVSRL